MSKKVVFTTISPLPSDITREVVLDFLHNHECMIDLNPLVKERHPITPPSHAQADEMHCIWYSVTDSISYLPGVAGEVSYSSAFHDLPNGIQTHCYAPAGVDIRAKWTLNGSLPGEPVEPVELGIGAPLTGLYLREDVELKVSIIMASFVKKTLKKSHGTLIERLKAKAQLVANTEPKTSLSGLDLAGARPPAYAELVPKQPAGLKPWPVSPYQLSRSTPPSETVFPRPPPPASDTRYAGPEPFKYAGPAAYGHVRQHSAYSAPRPAPHEYQRYSLPPATNPDTTLYPEPLRLRNPSTASTVTASSVLHDSAGNSPWPAIQPTVSTTSVRSETVLEHPDYPQMNPYADDNDGGSWQNMPTAHSQLGFSGPAAHGITWTDSWGKDIKQVATGGPETTGATLSGPFIAELE